MVMAAQEEEARAARLLDAQQKAVELFQLIQPRRLVEAGIRESEASDRIRDVAAELWGVSQHWHKRIVRAGLNTLQPFRQDPPDRIIAADDIVFCDFGPVFDGWEADFGRTLVLGADPQKRRLRDTLPVVWEAGKAFFEAHADITGEQLFDHVVGLAETHGWEFGGTIAGHLVGAYPHDTVDGERIQSYIAPGNDGPLRRTDRAGRRCHWILEVHLVDRDREIGGFYEELLDLA